MAERSDEGAQNGRNDKQQLLRFLNSSGHPFGVGLSRTELHHMLTDCQCLRRPLVTCVRLLRVQFIARHFGSFRSRP